MESNTSPYPLGLTGELSPQLSRGLWLVKWLLVIPHVVALVFLWVAFVVLTVVAFFAILFTGRHPRAIFDLNAVPDDATPAVLACGRERVNGAFEAVERVR